MPSVDSTKELAVINDEWQRLGSTKTQISF